MLSRYLRSAQRPLLARGLVVMPVRFNTTEAVAPAIHADIALLQKQQKEICAQLKKKRAAKRLERLAEIRLEKTERRKRFAARKVAMVEKRRALRIKRSERLAKRLAKRKALAEVRRERRAASAGTQLKRLAEKKARNARNAFVQRPWAAQGKLLSRSDLIYIKEKYPTTTRLPNETPFAVLTRLRKEYFALSAESRAPYEAKAAANREARQNAKSKIKGRRATPYAMFLKSNFAPLSNQVPSNLVGRHRIPVVAKLAAAKWTTMSAEEKGKYAEMAKASRAQAEANMATMFKQA